MSSRWSTSPCLFFFSLMIVIEAEELVGGEVRYFVHFGRILWLLRDVVVSCIFKRWFRVLVEEIYGGCFAIKEILFARGYVVEQTSVSGFVAWPGFARNRAARGLRTAPGPTAPFSRDECSRHRTAL